MSTDQEIKTAVIKNLQKHFSDDLQKHRDKLRDISKKIRSAKQK